MLGGRRIRTRVVIALVLASITVVATTGFTYTYLVSGPSGNQTATSGSNAPSNFPSVSGNGRQVAFISSASNLVASDTNGWTDAFARDVVANTTQRLSVSSRGAQANGPSLSVLAAADGTHFVFSSDATNLAPGDTTAASDVFERDVETGTTTLVSATPAAVSGNAPSLGESVSVDGHLVAFESTATDLVADDTNGVADVFVRDTSAGTTAIGSLDASGQPLNGSSIEADLSSTGRYLAFASAASNATPAGGNSYTQIYVRDLTTGAVTLVSGAAGGGLGSGNSRAPSVSTDGNVVVFESAADNLVSGDTNGVSDVFIRDMRTGVTTRLSTGPNALQGDGASTLSYPRHKSIDDAGCHVVFQSDATNLVAGDINATTDVFVWDCVTHSVHRVSMHADDLHQDGFGSAHAAMSADGNYVSFTSREPLQSYDTNNHPDVYERFVGAFPEITSVTPASVTRGTSTSLVLLGSGFTQRFSIEPPAGATVTSQQWVSPTRINVTINVSSTVPAGNARIGVLDLGTGPGLTAGSEVYRTLTIV